MLKSNRIITGWFTVSRSAKSLMTGAVCLLCVMSGVRADTHYVDVNSASAASPYTSWATAATNIQSAVNEALDGDTVLVAEGQYNSGFTIVNGSMRNRIALTKNVVVVSVGGPSKIKTGSKRYP